MNQSVKTVLIITIFVWFMLALTWVVNYDPNVYSKCSDSGIKEHISSLTHSYTDQEKTELVPKIKSWLIQRGEC